MATLAWARLTEVNEYRAYLIDRDGHIQRRLDMFCASDEAANGYSVELCQLDRRVASYYFDMRNVGAVSPDDVR